MKIKFTNKDIFRIYSNHFLLRITNIRQISYAPHIISAYLVTLTYTTVLIKKTTPGPDFCLYVNLCHICQYVSRFFPVYY